MLPKMWLHRAASKTRQKRAPQQRASLLASSITSCARTARKEPGPLRQATAHGFRMIVQESEQYLSNFL
jgi:hypothetical protein